MKSFLSLYKRGQGQNYQIAIAIIVILVVAVVLFFLFNSDVNKFIKNLPTFSGGNQEDEEIDIGDLDDEQIEILCPFRIGGLSEKDGLEYWVFFCDGFDLSCGKKINSRFYFSWEDGKKLSGNVYVEQSWSVLDWFDDKVGSINNREVDLLSDLVLGGGSAYDDVEGEIKDLKQDFIRNLDGSYYFPGGLICRKELVA